MQSRTLMSRRKFRTRLPQLQLQPRLSSM